MGADADIDMDLQFPSVNVGAIGNGIDMPTEEELLRAIMGVVQSSPKMVCPISYIIVPSAYGLIQFVYYIRRSGGNQSPTQDVFELFCETGVFDL